MLEGLNHITLAVADVDRALVFYCEVLAGTAQVRWDRGAYVEVAGVWLCLALQPPTPRQDDSHISFSTSAAAFADWDARLRAAGAVRWKENTSEGASLYFCDPDGHKLEIHVGDLQTRLAQLRERPYAGLKWCPESVGD